MGRGTSQSTTQANWNLADFLTRKLHLQLPTNDPKPTVKQHLSQLVQAIHIDFIVQETGWQDRSIASRGEAITMSMLEACPASSFALGPKASMLLESLYTALLKPDSPSQVVPPSMENGECFLYHAMFQLLQQDRTVRRWISALRKNSPLTRLVSFPVMPHHQITFSNNQSGIPSLTEEEMVHLLNHPLLPYFVGFLADHWADIPWPHPQKTLEDQLARINARRATLQLFLEQCIKSEKLSLLVVFPLMYQRLVQQDFVQKVLALQQFRSWKLSVKEQMLLGYQGLLTFRDQLDQVVQEKIVEPGAYAWNRPGEVRVFMQRYGKQWMTSGLSEQVQDMKQHLHGQMG